MLVFSSYYLEGSAAEPRQRERQNKAGGMAAGAGQGTAKPLDQPEALERTTVSECIERAT